MNLSILGSTGSVGSQCVEVAKNLGCNVDLLVASKNYELLEKQARELKVKVCVLTDENSANILKTRLSDTDIKVYGGKKSMISAIEESNSSVALNAISGFDGLYPALALARCGKRIAMSNKEAIVVAYNLLKKEIDKNNASLVPVDSEHSAIFQCLQASGGNKIKKIILTSSGGPFRHLSYEQMKAITKNDALNHPTWKMGPKITVDSASLMNKGFEVIEAVRLFGVKPQQIEVVVHPQSVLHSAIEFYDNSVIGQMGTPDMRTCIQYAITYPKREVSLSKELDLTSISSLTFEKPRYDTFTLLKLAFEVISKDGILPSVLNAADEVAVDAFLNDKIRFTDIFEIVNDVVSFFTNVENPSLDDIISADYEAREKTKELIFKLS